MRRHVLFAALVVAWMLSGPGCGLKAGLSPSTPQAAFESVQKAFAAGEFGAVYDAMSQSAQTEFAASLKDMAEKSKDAPPLARQLIGFDPVEVSKLPPREAFAAMMKAVRQAGEKLGKALGGSGSKSVFEGSTIKSCTIQGERAELTVEYASGSTGKVEMVREGGQWKLAANPAGRR